MPNDAKLGMIVGVGLVIAIAVVFFHKDAISPPAGAEASSATAVHPLKPTPAAPRGASRTVKARTAVRFEATPVEGQRHTVTEGETLFSLAQRYYQDEKKYVEIYRVNRKVVKDPEALTPGTVLIIPNLP
jgi:nucleoid-associated protein YgaU